MASFAEVREELAEKRVQLQRIFEEAGPDLDLRKVISLDGTPDMKAAEIQRRNEELNQLGAEYDRLQNLENIAKLNDLQAKGLTEPSGGNPLNGYASGHSVNPAQELAKKGLKQALIDHKGYRQFREASNAGSVSIDLPVADFKALVTLTTINAQAARQPGFERMAMEERTVADLMLQGNTDRNSIEYYEETTFTNAAATVAEGVAKPESAVGFTLRTEPVRKIAHFIPATKEALDDVSFLESQLRGRLAFGVQRREEAQILTGDGLTTNLTGLVNRIGIQTQAKGTDPTPDAIYRAMQKIRGAAGSGFAEPTGVVLHPNDWTDIKLLRTADGIYIWGNPSDEGPDRIWGLMVRQTTAMTENTGLVGAFRPHAEIIRREGITVTLSSEHGTFFTENKVAILAESRLALAVYRPSAFATVTGI